MITKSLTMLLAGMVLMGSCIASSDLPDYGNEFSGTPADKTEKRYLALGDSYTIGEAVPEEQRFPVQLQRRLTGSGKNISPPQIVARTGWTTDELKEGIRQAGPRGNFDLVTLLIGVNNQYRGRDTSAYRREFRELLTMAIGFAGNDASKVVVLSIPDYGKTPFGLTRDPARIAREIDHFNRINREEAMNFLAEYADITPISRRGLDDPDLVAADGLHPSGKMYGFWVELMLPAVLKILD
jgi:lysophospholipase L1-like esterase